MNPAALKRFNNTVVHDFAMDIKDDSSLDGNELIARTDSLTTTLAGKEYSVESLTAQVEALRAQVAEGDKSVETLTAQVEALRAQVAEGDKSVETLTAQVEALRAQVADKDKSLQALHATLGEFRSIRGWRLVRWLWQIRICLVPHGSSRAKFAGTVYRRLGVLRRGGLVRLLKALIGKIGVHGKAQSVTMLESLEGRRGKSQSLAMPASRNIETAALFDAVWYLSQYPHVRDSGMRPFEHYLEVGSALGHNPSPLFNTAIYARAHGVDPQDALVHFHDSRRLLAPGAYRTPDVLIAVQRSYQLKMQMECVEDRRSEQKPFAVYLRCGSGSVHTEWLHSDLKPWHLIVSHYDATYVGNIPCDVEFRQVGSVQGTKFSSFDALLTTWPSMISEYEYLLLLDGDVVIDERDISHLFEVARKYSLDLAQASLSSNSYCSFPVFRNAPGAELRFVNAVEIMMPVISQRALRLGKHLFGQTISGWGLDVVLGHLVRATLKGRAAVIDSITAEHLKPIDTEEGSFYKMLHGALIYPEIELTHLQRLYRVVVEMGEITPPGAGVGGSNVTIP